MKIYYINLLIFYLFFNLNIIYSNNSSISGSFSVDSNGNIINQNGFGFYVYYDSDYTIYDEESKPKSYIVTFLKPFCNDVSIVASCNQQNTQGTDAMAISSINGSSINGSTPKINNNGFKLINVPQPSTVYFMAIPFT
jgi:hypothetical protein